MKQNRISYALAAALVGTVALVGCKKKEEPVAAPPAAVEPAPAPAEPAPAPMPISAALSLPLRALLVLSASAESFFLRACATDPRAPPWRAYRV